MVRLSQPSITYQELHDRLVPTNDKSLVRTIRSLLLNVDDSVPMIPLTRQKPVAGADDATRGATDGDTAIAEEEPMPSQIQRDISKRSDSTKEMIQKQTSAAATGE